MCIPEKMNSFNFETSSSGEHYNATGEYIKELQSTAESYGRKYYWMPLALDYDIPEISHVDYRVQCPLTYVQIDKEDSSYVCVAYYLLPHREGPNGEPVIMPAVQVSTASKTEINRAEMTNYARAIAYLRFALRDKRRESDREYWNNLYLTHIVSNNVVPIFSEDIERAQVWAQATFPSSLENATHGKVGEFAFESWASERRLSITKIDIEVRNQPDHYDFLYKNTFSHTELKIDVKAYLETKENKKRKHWNINTACISGSYAKDIFVFVVLEEDMKYATIVGMLFAKDVKEKGEYRNSYDNYSRYYRVYEQYLRNPYYIQALFDDYSHFINGTDAGVLLPKVLKETIKDYPMDPILANELGYPDPYTTRRGGLHNLCSFATKKSVIHLEQQS